MTTKLEFKLIDWSARLGRGVILDCLALTGRLEVETKCLVLGRYVVEEVTKAGVLGGAFGKASLQRRTATPPGSQMLWLSGGADGAQAAGQRLPASCLLPALARPLGGNLPAQCTRP